MQTKESPYVLETILFTSISKQNLGKSKPSVILPLISLISLQSRLSWKMAEIVLIKSVLQN